MKQMIRACCRYARFERGSRYYEIRLEKDLLDDWVIVIINGRINSRLGRQRISAYETLKAAIEEFDILKDYRIKKRAYRCVNEKRSD